MVWCVGSDMQHLRLKCAEWRVSCGIRDIAYKMWDIRRRDGNETYQPTQVSKELSHNNYYLLTNN